MIEVTCAACGSTQRFPDADGGKVAKCAKCQARLTVPRKLPAIPPPTPGSGGGTGDVINLSDLPAPKRPSPLSGVPAIPRPAGAVRGVTAPATAPATPLDLSGLDMPGLEMPALEMDIVDLPAPVGSSSRGIVDLPAPVGPSSRGIVDLPAPVGPSSRGIVDLPAPVGPSSRGVVDLPAPVGPSSRGIVDLPAPVGPSSRGIVDLPAPVGPSSRGIVDLPAPVGPSSRGVVDLPAPVGPSSRGVVDLPAPVGPSPRAPRAASPALRQGSLDSFSDLPAPVRAGGAPALDDGLDLVAPKRPSIGLDDGLDLVALDLPAPKRPSADGGVDLPAPKGFFDDLPAPSGARPRGISDLPAPVGASPSSVDLPAPKGFFDDLPAPSTPKPGASDGLAPKGFFDDLPGPRTAPPPTRTAPPPGAPRSRGLDLDDLDLAPPTLPPQPRTGGAPPTGAASPAAARTAGPIPLDLGGGADDVPALELDAPADRYGGLDLPNVPPAGTDPAKAQTLINSGAGVSFKPGGGDGGAAQIRAPKPDSLDLEVDETNKNRGGKPRTTVADRPKEPAKAGEQQVRDPKRRRQLLLGALLVVVVLGGGGVFLWQRVHKQHQRTAQLDRALDDARRWLGDGSVGHWQKAANAAEAALAVDPGNDEALGIALQGYVAGYLEEGTGEKARRDNADRIVDQIHHVSATGPQVDKGLALYGAINNDVEGAIETLRKLVNPKDPDVSLFLGWAEAANRAWDPAIAAFEVAANAKNRAVPATYEIALAQLAKGDLDAARVSFGNVNDLAKRAHLGAQVGIAATMPAADYLRQESELKAILNLDEIHKGDPRVEARAWALRGDDARRAGRLDEARDCYTSARAKQPQLVAAMVGEAEISLRENRLTPAQTALDEALALAPDDPGANLALADLQVRLATLADATTTIRSLETMKLPTVEQQVRLHMLHGRLLEAQLQDEAAVAEYAAAQTAAGEGDIAPAVAQASLLGGMALRARADHPVEAEAYLKRSLDLLAALEAKAKDDPESQLALGRAFLASGNGAKAEEYLKKALDARKAAGEPPDIEAAFQLVAALELQGKQAEAASAGLQAFKLDPSRTDMALKLAQTLEQAGRMSDAAELYEKLLVNPAVTVNTRLRAGLFYVHNREPVKAGVQGESILSAEPKNAAGMYLRGEAQFADAKYDDARQSFKGAWDADNQATYAEALGRASWRTSDALGDPQFKRDALIAYDDAARLDPKMLEAQLRRADLRLQNGEWQLALDAYELARQLAPNDPAIPLGMGVSLDALGKPDQAIEWLLKAVKLKESAEAWYRIFTIYNKKGNQLGKEAHALGEATRLAIQDERDGKGTVNWLTEALRVLGDDLKTAGNDRAACDAYSKYLSRNPPDETRINNVKVSMLGLHCRK